MNEILIDTISTKLTAVLDESTGKPAKWVGVFAKCDEPTSNGRLYSRTLWEKVIGNPETKRRLEGGMVGVLNHPKDGETDLFRSAIATFDLRIEADGTVVGEAKILPTPGGQTLKQLIDCEVRVGVSSRGKGSIGEDGKVNEDYVLITFDVVDNPAVTEATPNVSESKNQTNPNETIDGRSNMSVFDSYFNIESTITPTLKAVEEGSFDVAMKLPLDEILKNALKEIGKLVTEDKETLVTPMVKSLQERIISCRILLEKGVAKKVNDEPQKPDKPVEDAKPVVEADKPKQVDVSTLKKPADDGTKVEDVENKKDIDKLDEKTLKEYAKELEIALEDTEKKYKESVWALKELQEKFQKADVTEAVEKAVKENPALEEVRDILEGAASLEDVTKMVEKLVKITKKGETVEDDDDALPPKDVKNKPQKTGETVVEDDDDEDAGSAQFKGLILALDENTKKKE